ncbi:CopG family transcriptional regulator [Peptococcaceae bacterium SCADC1_2_3]|jgi:CopG family transcriptional regulator/antitoxin EndoAI|nr:CopG family transcriptional regulator [Peptococcaceae bacterium SCADC1_2_3]KFI36351.1 CopG family transcriptional regulator [Peptococcaceae bacterium SCADC1_2_3]KFI36362.1 CopG family transcriptional regulator [Peptococcaceae bacterium SCADC1_2_3]KFI37019.1 CopG family transcriptional regulator [Peptococcaceae bacterium SCADC1_2_3]KFI38251.1 CopG family transcriptional regulator [Peptococcaceae bacterium SCADC1_2_3]
MRKTIIWTISLPPAMAQKVDAFTKKEQRTRSETIREALRQYISMKEWEILQAEASTRAKVLGIVNDADVERMVDEIRS